VGSSPTGSMYVHVIGSEAQTRGRRLSCRRKCQKVSDSFLMWFLKGLRCRISPICTLSQNGYGADCQLFKLFWSLSCWPALGKGRAHQWVDAVCIPVCAQLDFIIAFPLNRIALTSTVNVSIACMGPMRFNTWAIILIHTI
jgi:hypothetical protein